MAPKLSGDAILRHLISSNGPDNPKAAHGGMGYSSKLSYLAWSWDHHYHCCSLDAGYCTILASTTSQSECEALAATALPKLQQAVQFVKLVP